jgi:predicted extracellular nuclease
VISEFRTRGPNGASDEFIELYNNSDSLVDVSGWKIRGSNNAGSISTRLTINNGTIIPARGHFLATNGSANGYSGSVPGDQSYTSGITNDGGIAITLPNDAVVDQVGMSSGSAFIEGMNLAPLPSDANQSYERKPGGFSGSTQDTNDNFNDFQLLTPSDPQNLSSNPTPGPTPTPTPTPSPTETPTPTPTPTVTPTPGPTATPTPTPNPTPTPVTKVVISQIYGGGGNSGATFKNDFIEIFNAGNQPINLSGWSVQYASASGTSWQVTNLTAITLARGQYYLIQEAQGSGGSVDLPTPDAIGSIPMAATAGKVALLNSTTALTGSGCPLGGSIQDFVGYGSGTTCAEGIATAAPSNTTAVLRNNNGCTDSDNNAPDFATGAPNPRNTSSTTNQCLGTFAPADGGFELAWLDLLPRLVRIAVW